MRPAIHLTGFVRVLDLLSILGLGEGRKADLYGDRQVSQSLTEVYYPLQSPKDINGKPVCVLRCVLSGQYLSGPWVIISQAARPTCGR